MRCALSAGDARENGLLAAALDEAISPAVGQRYVISRPVWPEDLAAFTVFWRSLTFREPLGQAWHPVPSGFASHKQRAQSYCAAWIANVGPGELLFAGREAAAGRDELAIAAAAGAGYITRRTLWH